MGNDCSLNMTTDKEDGSDFYPFNPLNPLLYLLPTLGNIILTITEGKGIDVRRRG
jgi:hypothetical protein